jgi:hypothetical protein
MNIQNEKICKKIWNYFFPEREGISQLREIKIMNEHNNELLEISGLFGDNPNLDKNWSEKEVLKGIKTLNFLIDHLTEEKVITWGEAYFLLDVSHIREKFEVFIGKELKGKNISNQIDYSIWYNMRNDKIFEVVKASSNWSWMDGRHLICLFSLNDRADFTANGYIKTQIEALGFEEWYEIYHEDLKPVYIEAGESECEIADSLIEALHPETKKEIVNLMFEQDKEEWIMNRFESPFEDAFYLTDY